MPQITADDGIGDYDCEETEKAQAVHARHDRRWQFHLDDAARSQIKVIPCQREDKLSRFDR